MTCSYDVLWKVIHKVENEEILAVLLPGFEEDSGHIRKLKKDYPNGSDFAKEVAKRWIEKHPEKATWNNLIKTLELKCVSENCLAQRLKEELVPQNGSVSSVGSSFINSLGSSWTESDPANSGNTIHSEESMDVTPTPLNLETADSMDETSGVVRSDSLATTSDCSSPPSSPMSLSSASSPSSSLTGFSMKARRDERVNALCKKNLLTVKRNFSTFVTTIKNKFPKTTIDIEAVKNELTYIYPQNADISGLDDMKSIIDNFLKSYEWDYWNCDHLCAIVDTYGNKEMKKAEKDYRKQLDHFFHTTKLTDYLSLNTNTLSHAKPKKGSSKHYLDGKRRSSSEYRDRLTCKIDTKISGLTLAYIEKLWQRTPGLPKIGVVLDKVCVGCLEVHWIILRPIITLEFRKKALLPEVVIFYEENKIIRVILNDECLYSTKDLTASISSDVFKLPTSESIEEEPEEDISEQTDKEALTTQEGLETVPPVTDEADEVKNKENTDMEINEELVKSKPLAKEESNTVSKMLLAECSKNEADIEVVRGYLEQTDCDVRIREDDDFKWTPLMWACKNNHFEIGRLLLKCQPAPQVDIQDKKEWSPLILASRAGDLEIVQGIVELGAEIDLPTNKKWTPLMWAAHEGHVEVARFLLEKGAFVDYPDENGWTPLMQASQEGHVDIVNLLIEYGAKTDHQTETSWCALMAATKNKNSEVVEALLKGGAEVNIEREDGTTALQVASFFEGNSDIIKTLIKYGGNVDHMSKDGMTPLSLAVNKGHLELVKNLIIDGRADINLQHPETGWTPIFFAAKTGNMDILKELLDNGAKTEMEGRNVIDVANLFEHEEMVSELKAILPEIKTQEGTQEPTGTKGTPTEVNVVATVNIKREAEIIALLLKYIDNRMHNVHSNQHRGKGIAPVENFAYQQESLEVTNTLNTTTPSVWKTIAVSEDPDDDLF